MEIERRERGQLVGRLVANAAEGDRKRLAEKFSKMPLGDLRDLTLIAPTANKQSEPETEPVFFFGAAGGGRPVPVENAEADAEDVAAMTAVYNLDKERQKRTG